jgi:hypothetical protein
LGSVLIYRSKEWQAQLDALYSNDFHEKFLYVLSCLQRAVDGVSSDDYSATFDAVLSAHLILHHVVSDFSELWSEDDDFGDTGA